MEVKRFGRIKVPLSRGGAQTVRLQGCVNEAKKTRLFTGSKKSHLISHLFLSFRTPVICAAVLLIFTLCSSFNPPTYKMAKLKYNGGGDWYGDRTALPNLIKFCNENLKTNFQPEDDVVDVGSSELFNY